LSITPGTRPTALPDIMTRAGRHEDGIVALHVQSAAINQDLAASFLDAEELVDVVVHLVADVLAAGGNPARARVAPSDQRAEP
jgi:hypothetical protein